MQLWNESALLTEELPGVGPGRLGPGLGAEPTAGASGSGSGRCLDVVHSSANTWVYRFTC